MAERNTAEKKKNCVQIHNSEMVISMNYCRWKCVGGIRARTFSCWRDVNAGSFGCRLLKLQVQTFLRCALLFPCTHTHALSLNPRHTFNEHHKFRFFSTSFSSNYFRKQLEWCWWWRKSFDAALSIQCVCGAFKYLFFHSLLPFGPKNFLHWCDNKWCSTKIGLVRCIQIRENNFHGK